MNPALQLVHRNRWIVLLVCSTAVILAMWLVLADGLMQVQWGRDLLAVLRRSLRIPVHVGYGLDGIMGIHTRNQYVYAVLASVGLALFWFTQMLALRPARRDWVDQLVKRGRPASGTVLSISAVAALTTVGAAAILWEVLGLAGSTDPRRDWAVLVVNTRFWYALATFAVAWPAWVLVLHHAWRGRDGYQRLVQAVFWLFVAGGLMLFGSGIWLNELFMRGVNWPQYSKHGAYTAAGMGLVALLWSLGPGVALIFASPAYFSRRLGLCPSCGYDLRGSTAAGPTTCPECGAAISPHARPANLIADPTAPPETR